MTSNKTLIADGGAQVNDAPSIEEGPNYDNPETAQKAREMAQQKVDEKRAQREQGRSVKHQLEQAADEETLFVTVFDHIDDVEFSTLSTNEATRLMSISERFEAIDAGEADVDEDSMLDQFREMVANISEILADNAVDESLQDPEWWADTLSLQRLVTVAQGLIAEDDSLSAEEVQEFRGE